MFHLDYLSCFFTVLATILLARKSWIGLVIAIVNSLIVCAIGLRTLQLGFIPANLFCICVYGFSMRSWLKQQPHAYRDEEQRQNSRSVADGPGMSPAMQHRSTAGTRRPSDLTESTAIKATVDGSTYLDAGQFHGYVAGDLPVGLAAFMAGSEVLNSTNNLEPVISTPAWRSTPSWMLIATMDRTSNPEPRTVVRRITGTTQSKSQALVIRSMFPDHKE
jgi:hypothetical protein